jgi:VanZ family protein
LWGLFIFLLCFLPGVVFPDVSWTDITAPDKWVHAILYGVWIVLFAIGQGKGHPGVLMVPAVLMLLFGGFVELFQEWVLQYRSGEWLDWVADAAGLALGLLTCFVLNRQRNKQ